jgi:GR25 family glycosyltransferase involved in LPS biosynthesis
MIFNQIFDHIYVINLKKSEDRRDHIKNEFKRVGIDKYDFFEATPHDSEEVVNLIKSGLVKLFPSCFRCGKDRCDCENNFLTPFQLGNWCSFIKLFNDIINNKYNFVLICEDDIVFSHQYKRIINTLLSKNTFNSYKINMNKPLLIRMGTAFNPDNHNSNANPIFLKNYSLCNPCFAINKEMAIVYLKYLKIIDYHSDVYFHQKIPKNVKGIQFFTMYPYPIYELSFVKSKQKFESQVRPKNAFRRMEYKEYLFLSSNYLLHLYLSKLIKKSKLDIKVNSIGYNGNIDYYLLMDENEKSRYYFKHKILLYDTDENNLKILNDYKHLYIYKLFINKINQLYNLNLNYNNIINKKEISNDNILENKSLNEETLENKSLNEKALENKSLNEKALENKSLNEETLENKSLNEKALENKSLNEETLENKSLNEETLENKSLNEETLENKMIDDINNFYINYKKLLEDVSTIKININNREDINKLTALLRVKT